MARSYAAKEDQFFHSRLNALASHTTEAPQPSSHLVAGADGAAGSELEASGAAAAKSGGTTMAMVGGEFMEVPKSFEEVHQLSQRNRQRPRGNDSKARQRTKVDGGEDPQEDEVMDVVEGQVYDQKALKAAKLDPNFYFSATADANMDCGMDSTVSLY